MKKTIVFLLVVACSLSAVAQKYEWNKNCVIAHRGAWKEKGFPQN